MPLSNGKKRCDQGWNFNRISVVIQDNPKKDCNNSAFLCSKDVARFPAFNCDVIKSNRNRIPYLTPETLSVDIPILSEITKEKPITTDLPFDSDISADTKSIIQILSPSPSEDNSESVSLDMDSSPVFKAAADQKSPSSYFSSNFDGFLDDRSLILDPPPAFSDTYNRHDENSQEEISKNLRDSDLLLIAEALQGTAKNVLLKKAKIEQICEGELCSVWEIQNPNNDIKVTLQCQIKTTASVVQRDSIRPEIKKELLPECLQVISDEAIMSSQPRDTELANAPTPNTCYANVMAQTSADEIELANVKNEQNEKIECLTNRVLKTEQATMDEFEPIIVLTDDEDDCQESCNFKNENVDLEILEVNEQESINSSFSDGDKCETNLSEHISSMNASEFDSYNKYCSNNVNAEWNQVYRYCTALRVPVQLQESYNKKGYACRFCGKIFVQSNNRTSHERIHTGEKPYVCPECGKGFAQLSNMVSHRRTHTGEKPYPCRMCDKKFASWSSRVIHERIHTGSKPYICKDCGRGFTQKRNLTIHERVHSFTNNHCTLERPHVGIKSNCRCRFCVLQMPLENHIHSQQERHEHERSFPTQHCNDKSFYSNGLSNQFCQHTVPAESHMMAIPMQ